MNRYLKRDLSRSPIEMRQVVLCTTNGTRRSHSSRRVSHDASQQSRQLGEKVKCLADAFCDSLLWNRTYGDSFKPLRFGEVWSGSFSFQPKTSRFNDCSGKNLNKNDASSAANLSPNDRAKMGNLHGSMRIDWRCIRHLCSRSGRRSIYAGRYLCSRLPTKTRNAHRGGDGPATHYRRRQHSIRCSGQQRTSGREFIFDNPKHNRCHDKCLVVVNKVRQRLSENNNV